MLFADPELTLRSQQLSAAKQIQMEKDREEYLVCTVCQVTRCLVLTCVQERLRNSIATGTSSQPSSGLELIILALDKHYVRQAVYDAQQRSGCMEGTRV